MTKVSFTSNCIVKLVMEKVYNRYIDLRIFKKKHKIYLGNIFISMRRSNIKKKEDEKKQRIEEKAKNI